MTDPHANSLCRRLTGFSSIEAMFEDKNYFPSIVERGPDEIALADAYDAEANRRGDPRRAFRTRFPTDDPDDTHINIARPSR